MTGAREAEYRREAEHADPERVKSALLVAEQYEEMADDEARR